MRILAFLVLAAIGLPAHAQLTKCVDERGRVHYTDKPIPGCKPTVQQPTPAQQPPPAAKKDSPKAAAKAAAKPKAEPPPSADQCKSARQQLEFLMSDRVKEMPNREARIGQVNAVIRRCR